MTTRVISLGDSWFHYPKGINRDGKVLFFNDLQETFAKGKGVGNIPFYLVHKFAVHINYEETTIGAAYDFGYHPVKSHDDNLGVCGIELTEMIYGCKRAVRVANGSNDSANNWMNILIGKINSYLNTYGVDRVILLLSGGGNDMVDDNLIDFVTPTGNKWQLNLPKATTEIEKLIIGWQKLFTTLETNFPQLNFHYIVHGYDNPCVSGRSIFNGVYPVLNSIQKLPDTKWLSDTLIGNKFLQNNQTTAVEAEDIIRDLLNIYNAQLAAMAQNSNVNYTNSNSKNKVHYIDLRPQAGTRPNPSDWANELHYDREKFIDTARIFKDVITGIV